jgi:hypothetical protein
MEGRVDAADPPDLSSPPRLRSGNEKGTLHNPRFKMRADICCVGSASSNLSTGGDSSASEPGSPNRSRTQSRAGSWGWGTSRDATHLCPHLSHPCALGSMKSRSRRAHPRSFVSLAHMPWNRWTKRGTLVFADDLTIKPRTKLNNQGAHALGVKFNVCAEQVRANADC